MYEDRVERAVALFKQGYNCSQSVCLAFSDMFGLSNDLALKVSSSFGGGIGRMRMVCGAASGMFILAGLDCGSTNPADKEAKGENYRVVQELAVEFAKRNGSLICGELLGLVKRGDNCDKNIEACSNLARQVVLDHNPEARTEDYYKKRPCVKMVEEGARIFADYLEKKEKGE